MTAPKLSPGETRAVRRLVAANVALIKADVRRNRVIVDAVDAGLSYREVAALIGMTHPTVAKIVEATR